MVAKKRWKDGGKTEDRVKTKDDEIIDYIRHKYIVDENEDLISNIFTYALKDKDLHFAKLLERYFP